MLTRFFRTLQAKRRLIAARSSGYSGYFSDSLEFSECQPRSGTSLPPYDGLAEVWHDYAAPCQWDYAAFLDGLAQAGSFELRSVLDLACGAGLLASRLAVTVPDVVGLDLCEAMLERARAQPLSAKVRYVHGDFRAFQIGQTFDAAVSGFNSLNYVRDIGELHAVFRHVAQHLEPHGVFVFDTITRAGMEATAGLYYHVRTPTTRFAIHFSFDASAGRGAAFVHLSSGCERHDRIPLDPADVLQAARESGLVVDDYFSHALLPGRWFTGGVCFFILRKQRRT